MLTQSELEWVAWKYRIRRDKDLAGAWCQNCPHLGRNAAGCYGEPYCPLFPDFADAAEFSERVVAKLAQVAAMQKKHHCCVDIDIPFHCPGWQSCAERIMSGKELRPCEFEMLKGARLAVEEEMDGTY